MVTQAVLAMVLVGHASAISAIPLLTLFAPLDLPYSDKA